MTEFQQYTKIINTWKTQSKKAVGDILKRIQVWKVQDYQQVEAFTKSINIFKKQLQTSQEEIIDNDWFPITLKIIKKFKKLSETVKKKIQKKPQLEKKSSVVIDFPQTLFNDVRQSQKNVVKVFYKNFVGNFPEALQDQRTVKFIKAVNKQVRENYDDKLDSQKYKRIDSICMHLAKDTAIQAKREMLQGKKTAKQVAEDQQSAYKDEQTLKRIQQNLKEQFEASQTGFYDNMKKDINKGASEECRFCKKKQAYCDDMKQIRASDQPMTRFMKCNGCGKNWRD